jgi:hypothetical protein
MKAHSRALGKVAGEAFAVRRDPARLGATT